MPTKAEFIKFNTLKNSMSEFDSAIETGLKGAGELAKQDNRNTVMDQDIISTVEKHLGKRNF